MLLIGDTLTVTTPEGKVSGELTTYQRLGADRMVITLKREDGSLQRVLIGTSELVPDTVTPIAAELDIPAARDLAEAILSGTPVIGSVGRTLNYLALAVRALSEGGAHPCP